MRDYIQYQVRVYPNGTKEWYLNGRRHRDDGPAVEYSDGTKYWYLNCKLHREDGPAIESSNGDKAWYLEGKLHREDGPAIEYPNGTKSWYLNDKKLTEEEYNRKMNPVRELTVEQISELLGFEVKVVK
jgi:hypothetical protein